VSRLNNRSNTQVGVEKPRPLPRGVTECKMCQNKCGLFVLTAELCGAGCPRGKEYAVFAGLLPEE
jgi:hypothetical protein